MNNFSSWNVRDCDPLIEVLETWKPYLVPWILDNLLDQLVMPRLIEEVAKWDPLTDTVPIHTWIHPWIPLIGTYDLFIIMYPLVFHMNCFFYICFAFISPIVFCV